MWEILLALGAICVFLVGLGTSIWWIIKLFVAIVASPQPKTPKVPTFVYQSRVHPSPSAPQDAQPRDPASLDRAEVLNLVQREISRAANFNKIDKHTYLEVRKFIDRERELLKRPQEFPLPHAQGSVAGSEGPQEGGDDALAPHPGKDSLEPAAAPLVPLEVQPRDPERIRAVIAKLHADAHGPVPPAETCSPGVPPGLVIGQDRPGGTPELRMEDLAAAKIESVLPEPPPRPTPTPPKLTQRPWTERLFTPENVRILQSIGICIIFISAAAFVRTRMWNDASDIARLAILCLGTVACSATGYAMRRWLSLRITGLGFLILGQLSLILDTYSTLIGAGSGHAIYPYPPSSLWTLSFIVFTLSAAWKARLLKEPLFDAFTYFGGLAAWGSAMLLLGVDPYLLPATFVIALALPAALSPWLKTHCPPLADLNIGGDVPSNLPRWTLPWWVNAGFQTGTALLATVLPAAALLQGRAALAANFPAHALALGGLAVAIYAYTLGDSKRLKIHPVVLHAGSVLLLIPVPLAAYAFQWPLTDWSIALAGPGACMALFALLLAHFVASKEKSLATLQQMLKWGLSATLAGLAWSAFDRLHGDVSPASIWTVAGAFAVTVAIALLEDQDWAVWISTACVAFETFLCVEFFKFPMEYLPAILLSVAAFAVGLWSSNKRAQGVIASNVLAALGAGLLFIHAPFLPNANGLIKASSSICSGWSMLCAFLLLTSVWNHDVIRRSLGIAALSPAAVYWLYHFGVSFGAPAPWIAFVVLIAILAREFYWPGDRSGAFGGLAAIFAHATILASYLAIHGSYAAAALSFAVLALSPLALSFSAWKNGKENWTSACEFFALLLLGVAGIQLSSHFGVADSARPVANSLIAVALVAAAKLFELISRKFNGEGRVPFRRSGEQTALLFSGLATVQILMEIANANVDALTLLTTTWPVALVPLFVTLRARPSQPASEFSLPIVGGVMAAGIACVAGFTALQTQFWLASCGAELRLACAEFLAVALAASAFGLIAQRRWFSPLTGTLASLGLIGCAFGNWHLPPQAFGLCCAMLGIGLTGLALLFRNTQSEKFAIASLDGAFRLSIGLAFVASSAHLAYGLIAWPADGAQAYAVAAWLLMCGLSSLNGLRASFGKSVFAGLALSMAACHAMRWSGLEFAQFGPGLCATALLILLYRDLSSWISDEPAVPPLAPVLRTDGMILSSLLAGFFGFALGVWGMLIGCQWLWCATLAESALLVATLTMIARREWPEISRAKFVAREMVAWLLLTFSIVAAADVHAADFPLAGPLWVLLGALFLVLGMAGETIVSALSGKARPEPFLESRHLAALALGLYGLFDALFVSRPGFSPPEIIWRTLFGLAAFTIYESFARSTSADAWMQPVRKLAAGAAYLVLLPAGYLTFLQANSQGGSWGAMFFMLLAPVLMAAAHVLAHEKQDDQARMARWGVIVVNAGALILSFAGNREHLAIVPTVALGAIALQLLVVRTASVRRWCTAGVCIALAGSVHFGSQALIGFPLDSPLNPWSMQMPIVAALGVLMAIAGGALKIEEIELGAVRASHSQEPRTRSQEPGFSLVAICGACLTSTALLIAIADWIAFGSRAKFPYWPNTGYLDALTICVLFFAAASLCAGHWLKNSETIRSIGQWAGPLATLAGYFMFVFKEPPAAWEWYTLPAAGFLFAWAWQAASENAIPDAFESLDENALAAKVWLPPANAERNVALLLALASVLAVGPSFVQAIDHDRGTGHFFALLAIALTVVFGAMMSRRKIPLMIGTAALITSTIIKAAQWAHHREGLLPLLGIALGFTLVAVSTLFESRMNQAFHKVVDRARAEARMFWVSWR